MPPPLQLPFTLKLSCQITFPRDGCRPFIEIFGDSRLFTTCTEYDKLVQYTRGSASSIVWKDVNVSVDLTTDLQLVIYHARSTIGSKMLSQAKLTPIRMTSTQFNLFFEAGHQAGSHQIAFTLKELDDIEELDRFPHELKIEINFEVYPAESDLPVNFDEVSQNEILFLSKPESIFSGQIEYDEFKEAYGSTGAQTKPKTRLPTRPPPPSP